MHVPLPWSRLPPHLSSHKPFKDESYFVCTSSQTLCSLLSPEHFLWNLLAVIFDFTFIFYLNFIILFYGVYFFFGLLCWLRWQRICLHWWRRGFDLWVGKILWRIEWVPTPVFLPGEFCGQSSLEGYSIWGCKESDMAEWLILSFFYALVHMPSINTQTNSTSPENPA